MKENKYIQRDEQATKIFDDRSLDVDYRTLKPILKKGMSILDVVGPTGSVIEIDNTERFILSGKETYGSVNAR